MTNFQVPFLLRWKTSFPPPPPDVQHFQGSRSQKPHSHPAFSLGVQNYTPVFWARFVQKYFMIFFFRNSRLCRAQCSYLNIYKECNSSVEAWFFFKLEQGRKSIEGKDTRARATLRRVPTQLRPQFPSDLFSRAIRMVVACASRSSVRREGGHQLGRYQPKSSSQHGIVPCHRLHTQLV